MKPNPTKDLDLLKQFIQNTITSEPVFGDNNPRPPGIGFSDEEMEQVYLAVGQALSYADSKRDHDLLEAYQIDQFKQTLEGLPGGAFHFLNQHWRALEPLIDQAYAASKQR